MKIGVAKEKVVSDKRVPIVPAGVKKLVELGAEVLVEKGIGASISIADKEYEAAGAQLAADQESVLKSADMILRLNKPTPEEAAALKPGTILVSFLDPFGEKKLLQNLAKPRSQSHL